MINVPNVPLKYFDEFVKKNNAKSYDKDCDDYDLRKNIREDLLFKQKEQCAYCERRLDTKSKNFHIEHIYPRDKNPKLSCVYLNLVLSCNSKESCGEYKKNKQWNNDFIHPVLHNPTNFFIFSYNGEILSSSQSGTDTINFLNLNSQKLIRLRRNLILQLQSMRDIGNVSEYFNEFENLIQQMSDFSIGVK